MLRVWRKIGEFLFLQCLPMCARLATTPPEGRRFRTNPGIDPDRNVGVFPAVRGGNGTVIPGVPAQWGCQVPARCVKSSITVAENNTEG